jgi:hypothetical protein
LRCYFQPFFRIVVDILKKTIFAALKEKFMSKMLFSGKLAELNEPFIMHGTRGQPNPVNCKEEYHYRSGSTKQEMLADNVDQASALPPFEKVCYFRRW